MKYYSKLGNINLVDVVTKNKKPVTRRKTGRDYISPTQTTYKSFRVR